MLGPCCLMRFKSLRLNFGFGFGGATCRRHAGAARYCWHKSAAFHVQKQHDRQMSAKIIGIQATGRAAR